MIEISNGWAAVLVAIIGAAQAVTLALLARQSRRMKKVEAGTQVVVENTQNSHDTLLRNDLDDKHDETTTLLRQIATVQKEQGGAIIGIRQDLRQLREVDSQHARDIAEVRQLALGRKDDS